MIAWFLVSSLISKTQFLCSLQILSLFQCSVTLSSSETVSRIKLETFPLASLPVSSRSTDRFSSSEIESLIEIRVTLLYFLDL